MNFGTLRQRIEDVIGRAPSDICYELTTASVNEGLRLDSMLSTSTTDTTTWPLPSSFLEVASVYFEQNDQRREVESASDGMFNEGFEACYYPRLYNIANNVMHLNPWNSGVTVNIRYYGAFTDFASDTDTNFVLRNHPSVYVYGVLMHHNALIRSQQAANEYRGAFGIAMRAAQNVDKRKNVGAFPSRPIARATP